MRAHAAQFLQFLQLLTQPRADSLICSGVVARVPSLCPRAIAVVEMSNEAARVAASAQALEGALAARKRDDENVVSAQPHDSKIVITSQRHRRAH